MLHHALRSLATLKAYQAEHEILQALLGQDSYRRGSRARWYERRAILEMTQLSKADGGKRDQDVLWQAMNGVKEALLDEDTGIGMTWYALRGVANRTKFGGLVSSVDYNA